MDEVTIVNAPQRQLAGLRHIGAYDQISQSFEKLGAIFTSRNLWPQVRYMAALYFDDPAQVPVEKLRSFAAVELNTGSEVPEGLQAHMIDAGETAQLVYKGAYSGLPAVYDMLYGQWLPNSGRVPTDAPSYEIYLNSPMDTAPEDLLTQVCIPLQPKTTG